MDKNILIVDDELDVCNVLKEALEYEGYKADIVTTGKDALSLLNEGSYELSLIDVRLEGSVSGIDVIKHCRKLPRQPKILVISATPKRLLIPLFEQEQISDLILEVLEKPADLNPDRIGGIISKFLQKSDHGES